MRLGGEVFAEHHQQGLSAGGEAHGDLGVRGQHERTWAVERDQAAFEHRVGQIDQGVAPGRDHGSFTAVARRERFRIIAGRARFHQRAHGLRDRRGRVRVHPHRDPIDGVAPQGGNAFLPFAGFDRQHAHVRRFGCVVKDLGCAQELAAGLLRQESARQVGEQQRVDQSDLVRRRLAHESKPDAVVAQGFDEIVYAQRLFDIGLAVRILPDAEFIDLGDQLVAPIGELGYALLKWTGHAAGAPTASAGPLFRAIPTVPRAAADRRSTQTMGTNRHSQSSAPAFETGAGKAASGPSAAASADCGG